MPSTKTLRVTLQDIVGATGGAGSTATVWANYVTPTTKLNRDIHIISTGAIVVPVRREVTAGTGPEHFDFEVIPSDDADVREEDRGFAVKVSWHVVAPEGGTTDGSRTVIVPSTADDPVQLGSLYDPPQIPSVTAQRIISGGTAAEPLYDIRIRHDDSAGWAAEDPVLSLGEEGIDTDTGTRKVGDGAAAWSALPASGGGGGGGTSVHGDLTGRTAADQHPTSAITGLDAALAAAATDADLAAHAADATNIHGITDTSALVVTTDPRLSDERAPLPHTSASVTDFTEAAQDAIAALLAGASGVTLSYNDVANTLTITGPGATPLDPEAVRDLMGIAIVSAGLITVTVNDALDTITLSTTATANATDAALRDRSSHSGTQLLATISDAGNAAAKNVGTTAGTVAAGDDSRITGALSTTAAPELIRDTMATALVAGTNVTITPNDGADTITITAAGGGGSTTPLVSVGEYATSPLFGDTAPPNGGVSVILGRFYIAPFRFPHALTIDQVIFILSTSGASGDTLRIVLWADDGTGKPGTVIQQWTIAANTAAGTQAFTLTTAQAFAAGEVFHVGLGQQGSGTLAQVRQGMGISRAAGMRLHASGEIAPSCVYATISSGAAGNAPTLSRESENRNPYIIVRRSA